MSNAVYGVWAPAVTPLNKDFTIDCAALLAHIEWLLHNGCHGVALFGTTGEAPSFSAQERIASLEYLLAHNVNPNNLIIGNGFCALTDTIEVTRHAVHSGCNTVLMIPPFYFKNLPVEGVAASYRHVFDEVNAPDLRVVLYHFPKLAMVVISHDLIRALMDSHGEMIAALKDSSGDWSGMQQYIEQFPTLSVLPGSEVFLLRALQIGGAGTITATANINPHGIRQVFDQWVITDEADEQQRSADEIRAVISKYPLAAALKAVHAEFRSNQSFSRVRPPLSELSPGEVSELTESLRQTGFSLSGFNTDN